MSESLRHQPNSVERSKTREERPQHQEIVTQKEQQTENQAEKQTTLEVLQKNVESQAISRQETAASQAEKPSETSASYVNKELKDLAFRRSLSRIRSHLRTPERLLSTIVHTPLIEDVSEVVGKTAARPSGMFGGSIAALLGSGYVLYLAKHYGFEYNFLLFGLLFSGGFILGIICELAIFAIKKARGISEE